MAYSTEIPDKIDELVDGMENMGQTSFDDLPDDILIKFFTFADFPTRLNMRLNKRLDKIHRSIKMKLKLLEIWISNDQYDLILDTSDGRYRRNYGDFNLLENTLRGLNTTVHRLSIKASIVPSEKVACVINLLSDFDADQLIIADLPRLGADDRLSVPQVTLSTLLNLAQNYEDIRISITCDSVSAEDLGIIRKTMLEGNCKLKSFIMRADDAMRMNLVKECFGVTIEDGMNEHGRRTMIFRTTNESVEFFYGSVLLSSAVVHFEDDLQTAIEPKFGIFISFAKGSVKPDNMDKVKMNHLYVL